MWTFSPHPARRPRAAQADPAAKSRVLKRMEITLTKAARKGLAVTSLVQRGLADLLEWGAAEQRLELVNSLRDAAVHIMHTRDGARIACACVRHGDAKDRKALLKASRSPPAPSPCPALSSARSALSPRRPLLPALPSLPS